MIKINSRVFQTILVIFLLFPLIGLAQSLSNQKFQYITPDEGLSHSTVTTIVQDSVGFMWFGTTDGLNKYDGRDIVIYDIGENDSTTLPNSDISVLYEDHQGNFWVGTGGGLAKYIREKDHFKSYLSPDTPNPHSGRLSENTINDIYEDRQGNFWVATFNGLNIMDRETEVFKTYYHNENDPQSLSANHILEVYEDSYGNFWVATIAGINLMNREKGTFERYTNSFDVSGSVTIEFFTEDSKHRLWVGTDKGLFYYDSNIHEFKKVDDDIEHSEVLNTVPILSFLEDDRGILWVGTENEGLFAIEEKTGRTYHFISNPEIIDGLNKNSIYSLYESRDKILWIGTFDGGINYLSREKPDFEHYLQQPGRKRTLSNNSIYSFLEDHKGNFWVGTDGGGLNKFDRENELFYQVLRNPGSENALPSDVVLDLLEDSENQMWIGTYQGGLSRYDIDNNTLKTYKPDPNNPASLSQNEIFEIYEDRDGMLWVGTNGEGISKMLDKENGVFKHYKNSEGNINGLPNEYIREIYEDSIGRLWIASYGRGVILMNKENETFTDYNRYNGKMKGNVVLDIFEDSNGNLWAGTKDGGLALYDKSSDQFITYTEDDGLANNTVNGILEDDYGNLWLSTNDGISKFNHKEETFKNFGLEDGLQGREFKPGAAYEDSEGYMYFGGINGFNRFHPDSVAEDLDVPPVVLTDFQVFNKSIPIGENSILKEHINFTKQIEIPYTASVITFKYAALNFGSRSSNSYAYRLKGFDSDWHYVGEQNTATYTNLDHGEYTFELKTANAAGNWGEQINSVKLIITPPFWRTIWFYLIMGMLIVGLIIGGYRYRTRQITERNKILEQKVSKRTSELQSSNKNLKQALADLAETREELVQNAHKAGMADIATSVLHNIGNVLNSVTTSATISGDVLRQSKLKNLFKANKLLREHNANLEDFLFHNPKGQKLPDYYLKLDEILKSEYKVLVEHNKRLERKVNVINDIIAAQQSYASMGQNFETISLNQVLEDALTIFANSLERHGVTIKKDISGTDPVNVQKTKLVHVILNVLKNAKESMLEAGVKDKIIELKLWQDDKNVILRISDNGLGVKKKHLGKIFNHGFTTKKTGHGFGLHSSANYMTEMGGKIELGAESNSSGATFLIKLPLPDDLNTKEKQVKSKVKI